MQNVSKCSDTPKNRAANSPRFLTVSLTSLSRYTLKGKNFIFNYLLLVAVFFFFCWDQKKVKNFQKNMIMQKSTVSANCSCYKDCSQLKVAKNSPNLLIKAALELTFPWRFLLTSERNKMSKWPPSNRGRYNKCTLFAP